MPKYVLLAITLWQFSPVIQVAGRTRQFDCKLENASRIKQEVIILSDQIAVLSFSISPLCQVYMSKPHDSKKDFELNRKINNFVSKYYKA